MKMKKNSNKILPQRALNLGPQTFGSDTLLSELLRHVLLGDLRSIYISSHAALFLTKWSNTKIEVMQEQKTKGSIPNSTCFDSSERRALELKWRGSRFQYSLG